MSEQAATTKKPPVVDKSLVPVGNVQLLGDFLSRASQQFTQLLPKHMSADRVVKIALMSAAKEPRLLQCTKGSFYRAIMQACELGLEPGGSLGLGWLVPYNNKREGYHECQFIPGYRGLIDLARRANVTIYAHTVHTGDDFDYDYGLNPKLSHKPKGNKDPADLEYAYAVARPTEGDPIFDVMTRDEIEAIRNRNTKKFSPWDTDYNEMARKCPVRRLSKYLPLTPELSFAIELDVAADAGIEAPQSPRQVDVLDIDAIDASKTVVANTLKDKVKAKAAAAREPGEEG